MNRVLFVGLVLAAAACGSSNNNPKDSAVDSKVFMDAKVFLDAGSGAATFTSFTIDLVLNHQNDPAPAAFTTFSALPDPDAGNAQGMGENVHAYDSLF